MVDGATKSFQQSYNCQAAADEKEQIIIASGVTQDTNDKLQLIPLEPISKWSAKMIFANFETFIDLWKHAFDP